MRRYIPFHWMGNRAREDAPQQEHEVAETNAASPLVLVIEDNLEMNRFVSEALADECRTASAFNGREGIEKALALCPDLIISDVMMPRMSGDHLLREIRSHRELQDIPIVMLTTQTDEEMRVNLLRAGAQDYLIKPFSVEELRARVHNLLKVKRVREVLRRELESQSQDLEELANEVAKRKPAQELSPTDLQHSEERYRYLADAMPQIVWTARPDGYIDYYNRRWFEYTGLTIEQTKGWGWQPVLHPDDVERCLRRWSKAVETGEAYEIEYRFRRAQDGTYRWHLGRAVPMRDESGRVVKWFGTCTDIDDHKRAEEALRFIVEASGILAASLDYETTLANVARLSVPRLADWCVVHTVEEDGKLHQLAAAHKDETKLELLKEINRRFPSGLDSAHGYPLVVRTGEPELIPEITDPQLARVARDEEHLRMLRALSLKSTLCVPLRARGRSLGAITFATAESGRIYNMHDVALAENLAHRAATAVDNARLYQEAQRANIAKDEFLATLSHELRTPLTPVIGWVHMIRGGMLNGEELDRGLAIVEKNSQSLARLINDLLDMSAILSGKMRIEKVLVPLHAALQEAIETSRPSAESRNIIIEVKGCDDRSLIINGDRTRLVQSFWNILANAVKFSQDKGSVRVTCESDEAVVRIIVEDEGHGITPEFLPHVFERFRQEDSSKTRAHGGLGIGLALVKSFIEAHGGRVEAESAGTGRGSRFIVYLPRFGSEMRNIDSVIKGNETAATPKPVSVLVVEDSPDTLEMLRQALERRGYSVTPCASAEEALRAVTASANFDIIVSDIGMPEVDGYELIRNLRRLPQMSRVPAIAVSGYASPKEINAALAAGFDSHVAKPVDPDVLADEIKLRLRSKTI
jgi:PAS domain S-box-containing protein